MITPSFETLEMSSVILSKNPEGTSKPKYPSVPEEHIEFLELTGLKTKTTISIEELRTTPKEELIELLRNKNIVIKNEWLFYNLLEKLSSDKIKLITQIVEKLLQENYSFHIEVYETDGDLEELYFVIHYSDNLSDEEIDEDLFRLSEYVREINNNKVPWFIDFAREIKDV